MGEVFPFAYSIGFHCGVKLTIGGGGAVTRRQGGELRREKLRRVSRDRNFPHVFGVTASEASAIGAEPLWGMSVTRFENYLTDKNSLCSCKNFLD